jgi:hypothetical protein
LQAGRRGEIWKVDGCLLVLESTQNNGGAPSSCERFGDFLFCSLQLRVDDF